MSDVWRSGRPGGAFDLIDHDGRPVSEGSFRGRHVMIFFGFTHCRVVCPRALSKLSAVLDSLHELAERVTPLYITVDPDRDTPDVMRKFLRSYPRFTGLTGSHEQIDRAKRSFRVFAQRRDGAGKDGAYEVAHTAITYLLDPAGELILHFGDALSADEMEFRLSKLLTPLDR